MASPRRLADFMPGYWEHASHESMTAYLRAAERILAAPDSEFVVETYRGIHAQRDHEQLWPTTETEEQK